MNLRVLPGLLAWTLVSPFAAACGPFFPDTVLDKPQAALAVPLVSYAGELSKIAGFPDVRFFEESDDSTFLAQIPKEAEELKQLWTDLRVEPAEIEYRLAHYTSIRRALLKGLDATCANRFPTSPEGPPTLPERPLDSTFPPEVADYVEAARLLAVGQRDQARTLWKAILDRPIEQRRLRCVSAAWMLAKTSPDEAECLTWYERVEKEAAGGGTDATGLVAASMGWRAELTPDTRTKLHLYFEGFRRGHLKDISDVRQCSADLLSSHHPEELAAAAADPLARLLIHVHLQAQLSHRRYESQVAAESGPPAPIIPAAWLEAVRQHAKLPLPDGPRLAWAVYSVGYFDEAHHWLDLSDPTDPSALWLQAKFDLRSGKLEAAQVHLNGALKKLRADAAWNPGNPHRDAGWSESETLLIQANQGRLLADAGLVALGREDYLQALELLRQGGYAADSSYIAEHLLSTTSLLKHVKAVAPHASDRPVGEQGYFERYSLEEAPPEVDPATCLEPDRIGVYQWLRNPDNRLRYELARRLAREGRLDEAAGFMPPQLDKLFRHYLALDHARQSGRYKGTILASILWRQARIHRWWGAQLFSTDSFPDGGIYDWGYPAPNLNGMRSFREGWTKTSHNPYDDDSPWGQKLIPAAFQRDRAMPVVCTEEIRRLSIPRLKYDHRYHYRSVAADLAWQAAKLLPDGDSQLALLYNTAGPWVEVINPTMSDRFYEALIKRCPNTEIAGQAVARHWFVRDVESLKDLPELPAKLLPKPFKNGWKPKDPNEPLNDTPPDPVDPNDLFSNPTN